MQTIPLILCFVFFNAKWNWHIAGWRGVGFVESACSRELVSHRKIHLLALCSTLRFENASVLISSAFLFWIMFLSDRKKHLSTSEYPTCNWKFNPAYNIFSFSSTMEKKRHLGHINGTNMNVFHMLGIVELPWQLSPWRFLKYWFLGAIVNAFPIERRLVWKAPNLLIIVYLCGAGFQRN